MNKYKYGNHRQLLIYTFGMLLLSILGGISLYSMRLIVDYATQGDLSSLLSVAKYLVILLLGEFILKRMVTKAKEAYFKLSQQELKAGYLDELFRLDLLTISSQDQQVYLTQLTNDMDRYAEKFYLNLIYIIEIVLRLLVTLVILATLNIKLLFLALILILVFAKIAHSTSKPIIAQENIKSSALEKYTNYIKETLDGFLVIKQNLLQSKVRKKFIKHATELQEDNYNLDKKTSHVDALNALIQSSILLALIFMGLIFAKKQNLSLGTTLLAGTAFASTTGPMQQISPMITQMRGVSAILTGFDKVFKEQAVVGNMPLKDFQQFEFLDVDLGYDKTTILSNVNIRINKHEKVLIVGESGSGKSTILKSLRRQITPLQGAIYCNDIMIDNINAEDYFKQLAVVDQIGFIFNGTIQDNISLYKKTNREKIVSLLHRVGLEHRSIDFHLINNGANLSGGERARLLLARALFLNSNIIVSDEILASLDIAVAKEIEKDMLSLDQTFINVSHIYFEDTLSFYDKIYEVKQGRVNLISVEKLIQEKNKR